MISGGTLDLEEFAHALKRFLPFITDPQLKSLLAAVDEGRESSHFNAFLFSNIFSRESILHHSQINPSFNLISDGSGTIEREEFVKFIGEAPVTRRLSKDQVVNSMSIYFLTITNLICNLCCMLLFFLFLILTSRRFASTLDLSQRKLLSTLKVTT